jgi:hypothetical protein
LQNNDSNIELGQILLKRQVAIDSYALTIVACPLVAVAKTDKTIGTKDHGFNNSEFLRRMG